MTMTLAPVGISSLLACTAHFRLASPQIYMNQFLKNFFLSFFDKWNKHFDKWKGRSFIVATSSHNYTTKSGIKQLQVQNLVPLGILLL